MKSLVFYIGFYNVQIKYQAKSLKTPEINMSSIRERNSDPDREKPMPECLIGQYMYTVKLVLKTTCLDQPPLLPDKSVLIRQVVFPDRFHYRCKSFREMNKFCMQVQGFCEEAYCLELTTLLQFVLVV